MCRGQWRKEGESAWMVDGGVGKRWSSVGRDSSQDRLLVHHSGRAANVAASPCRNHKKIHMQMQALLSH